MKIGDLVELRMRHDTVHKQWPQTGIVVDIHPHLQDADNTHPIKIMWGHNGHIGDWIRSGAFEVINEDR